MMDNLCLVNLNARLYDPTIACFRPPNPVIERLTDLQDLNRYSYVANNPLSLSDPSGMCFLGCFWNTPVFRSIGMVAVATSSFADAVESAGSLAAVGGSKIPLRPKCRNHFLWGAAIGGWVGESLIGW